MHRLLVPIVALLGLLGSAPRAAAQDAAAAGRPLAARDSAREQRSARAEQSRFELIRRRNLPVTTGGGGGRCDERIGRFCLTHGDRDEKEWTPPPEAEATVRARDRLLARLEQTARRIPGDAWVAGQRIRYLVEARRFREARAALDDCRAADWWCAALAGHVHHLLGESGPADSAFAVMLRTMPDRERREWTDLSPILEGRALGSYRRMAPEQRAHFEQRFWALADPFHMRAGNDLRSEHLSRNLLDRLQDRARVTEGIAWGDDLREILIRYGWPSGWERIRPAGLHQQTLSMVSHYTSAGQVLLPPAELLGDSSDLSAGRWDEEDHRARTGYSLRVEGEALKWFTPLDHQVARFRRGDSAVVVAAYELPADSLPPGATVDAGLVLMRAEGAPPVVARRTGAGPRASLVATAPAGRVLASLELFAERERRAARARFGLHLPEPVAGALASSDLLLLRGTETLPDSLGAAAADARGSSRVRRGEQLGVYWELYGLAEGGSSRLGLSLRLVERRKGLLRRLAERAGVVRELDPIRIRWQEEARAAGPGGPLPRALVVQIPPGLSPGEYTLELTVTPPEGEPVLVERALEVVP